MPYGDRGCSGERIWQNNFATRRVSPLCATAVSTMRRDDDQESEARVPAAMVQRFRAAITWRTTSCNCSYCEYLFLLFMYGSAARQTW